jgi:hypothetical protein
MEGRYFQAGQINPWQAKLLAENGRRTLKYTGRVESGEKRGQQVEDREIAGKAAAGPEISEIRVSRPDISRPDISRSVPHVNMRRSEDFRGSTIVVHFQVFLQLTYLQAKRYALFLTETILCLELLDKCFQMMPAFL